MNPLSRPTVSNPQLNVQSTSSSVFVPQLYGPSVQAAPLPRGGHLGGATVPQVAPAPVQTSNPSPSNFIQPAPRRENSNVGIAMPFSPTSAGLGNYIRPSQGSPNQTNPQVANLIAPPPDSTNTINPSFELSSPQAPATLQSSQYIHQHANNFPSLVSSSSLPASGGSQTYKVFVPHRINTPKTFNNRHTPPILTPDRNTPTHMTAGNSPALAPKKPPPLIFVPNLGQNPSPGAHRTPPPSNYSDGELQLPPSHLSATLDATNQHATVSPMIGGRPAPTLGGYSRSNPPTPLNSRPEEGVDALITGVSHLNYHNQATSLSGRSIMTSNASSLAQSWVQAPPPHSSATLPRGASTTGHPGNDEKTSTQSSLAIHTSSSSSCPRTIMADAPRRHSLPDEPHKPPRTVPLPRAGLGAAPPKVMPDQIPTNTQYTAPPQYPTNCSTPQPRPGHLFVPASISLARSPPNPNYNQAALQQQYEPYNQSSYPVQPQQPQHVPLQHAPQNATQQQENQVPYQPLNYRQYCN